MAKEYTLSKTSYLKLQGYLYDLQIDKKAYVFSELSGHIDVLNIRICPWGDYNTNLYGSAVNWFHIRSEYKIDSEKEVIKVIEDIEDALSDQQNKIKKAREADKLREIELYNKLKDKYKEL